MRTLPGGASIGRMGLPCVMCGVISESPPSSAARGYTEQRPCRFGSEPPWNVRRTVATQLSKQALRVPIQESVASSPARRRLIATRDPILAAPALADLRGYANTDDGPLMRAVLNAVSPAETGFALGLLAERIPHRTLVAALNLRETLVELPEAPFQMRVDFETLARIVDLTRRGLSWIKCVREHDPVIEIELLGQGNLVYDIGVRRGERSSLLKPGPIKGDIIRPDALALVLAGPELLEAVIELTNDMGMVHNPRFYLSVEDWQMEHAAESFGGITDLF